MRETVIVEAVRTPVGKRNGGLSEMHAADLSALVLTALVERAGIDPEIVDDVVWGCVSQVGDQSSNIGRYSVLAAGWPETIPGTTVNRACGSSQQALDFAVQAVMSGQQDVVVAGGVEVMSRVPLGVGPRHRHAVRPESACALRRFLVQPGHLRRDDRAEVGVLPHPARRVLGVARTSGRPPRRTAARSKPRSSRSSPTATRRRRRGGAARHQRREARRAQAGVQGRRRHPRGQLVADLRRRRRAAGDDGRERGRAGARPRSRGTAPAPSPAPTRCSC